MSTEFQTSTDILKLIADLIYTHSGITFPNTHLKVLDQRIQAKLKEKAINEKALYSMLLLNNKELFEFIGFVTTNHTHFFRSIEQFKILESRILPELLEKNRHIKHISIWSCACSSGEEPYTLALCLQEYFDQNNLTDWHFSIIATDIDQTSLRKAIDGQYAQQDIKHIPIQYHQYLDLYKGDPFIEDSPDYFMVKPNIQKNIRFQIHNLLDTPIYRNVDIIFCRNVLIYFDTNIQTKVISQLASSLSQNRYLFISPTETISELDVPFTPIILPETIYYINS